MPHKVCHFCDGRVKDEVRDYISPILDKDTGLQIIVPGVRFQRCSNAECDQSFLTSDQEDRIDAFVARRTRYVLSPGEIKQIRESLPFETKAEAANFLLLNSKAFIKWEAGYTELNSAYDLLLRLVAFDQRNFHFIQFLHQKNFRYDPADYQLISVKNGLTWNYSPASVFRVSEMESQNSKEAQKDFEAEIADNQKKTTWTEGQQDQTVEAA